ncbi:MAG: glycine--tRNA ligase subunit beta, partial [Pseudomonadota bacterium]
DNAEFFVTPRRIALIIEGLPKFLPERIIERKGPKIDAKPEAIEGFLRSVGMKIEELSIIDNFYYAKKLEAVKPIGEILKQIIETMLTSFTWPKSMRSAQSKVKWIRPLRNILCIFDKNILPIEFSNLKANNISYGHRFMANASLNISSISDYKNKMEKNFVILSHLERQENIQKQIEKITKSLNLTPVVEQDLLNEVTGLVEYPNVLLCRIDQEFLELPKEVLITAMKVHQRYFYLEEKTGSLAPYFLTVANVDFKNNEQIIAGNEKVLRARLSDAKFFYKKDLKTPSSEGLARLTKMTFHHKLGNMFDKVNRIIALAEFVGNGLFDNNLIKKAALLCKIDLVSEMVGEFPELQGIMGKYYALHTKQEPEVALAIAEHYRPIDANDIGDTSLLGAIISIADKLDTIVGLWLAGEKPSSSKDPFALRRSALGIIKLINHHSLNLSLSELIERATRNYDSKVNIDEILVFFNDRLKYYLKGEDYRHDLIMASLNTNSDNIYQAISNLNELQEFVSLKEAEGFILAIKRILNILSESKSSLGLEINKDLFIPIEQDLFNKIFKTKATIQDMKGLVNIINQFFDEVMVNDPDPNIRQNRLNLLFNIAVLSKEIADFSLIEI